MQYNNLIEVRDAFLTGHLDFFKDKESSIIIEDKEYLESETITPSIRDLIESNHKIFIVYSLKENVDNLLVFAWAVKNSLQIIPIDAQIVQGNIIKEAPNQPVLGETAQVEFTSLPNSKPLKARVDTGAEISSLHVDSLKPGDGVVQFTSKELSDKVITMHPREYETVKSANGESKRPVVMMDIKVNGKPITGVLFNLANRGDMEFPVLLGKNALEKGGFLVNPAKESVEIKSVSQQLQEHFKNIEVEFDPKNTKDAFDYMRDKNVTLEDLIKVYVAETYDPYQ